MSAREFYNQVSQKMNEEGIDFKTEEDIQEQIQSLENQLIELKKFYYEN